MIEKLYKNIYADMEEKTKKDDMEISDKLTVLLESINMEKMDKETLNTLLCKASIIGQEQGFKGGARFLARFILELLE